MIDKPVNIDEQSRIQTAANHLIATSRAKLGEDAVPDIQKAVNLAIEAHSNQRRKSGEAYIFHPIAVAQIVVDEVGLGKDSVIAALLHDVVEDTDVTLEYIEKLFGTVISRLVDGLTKIKGLTHQSSEVAKQAENLRKILLTLSEDIRTILIKIADRLHNMRTLNSLAEIKQVRISSETLYIYAPLAHRLGLYAIKTELEDLSLKHTRPQIYKDIAKRLEQTKRDRELYINEFITPINKLLEENHIENARIFGRPKSIHSIWNKIRSKGVEFEEIYDLFAIRIIVDVPLHEEKAACWRIFSIITDVYRYNPDRTRDWISFPKSNGYESLHLTVLGPSGKWVEVQIRTKRMDEIAEKGVAAHWKYKGGKSDVALESWLVRVREFVKNPTSTNAVDFMNDFKHNLYDADIFVFTPKGDLKMMPSGSSVLDFAFEIHTEVGSHCLSAKVNGKLCPISYKLKSGDQVEILTSSKQKPNEDWLNYTVTSRARSKIKAILKEEIRKEGQNGKEIFERKLRALKLPYSIALVDDLVNYFKTGDSLNFFYQIATGGFNLDELKKLTFVGGRLKNLTAKKASVVNEEVANDAALNREADILIFGGMDNIDYSIARCCNPQSGDPVFGFITINQGIKIHHQNCPNAADLRKNYSYRIVTTKWNKQNNNVAFLTGLRVIGMDNVGLINRLTKIISDEMKINMRSISFDTDSGVFEGNITVYVENNTQLKKLIKRLYEVEGVQNVKRYDS
ncbi:MAG: bifunctional (p)ppGpp synthetase/guanosine-3',5'-bis(diphosphate) 3'-pyrophosphohydrolase [Bacteroidetes bacterium]|nr:bifunctional (p)ppGpp synthetase/guanosine-3',5'-bis(diphosphate) 3'-pyrophosphohydrolase [Bacteroidota bacterium]MCB9043454.1 bifunctional (p)ppGpp synthetase/guanosine-3',5'-bis(diphosphate) 3'-pyrophosphohydrolase [Chitinophagales bacterium]